MFTTWGRSTGDIPISSYWAITNSNHIRLDGMVPTSCEVIYSRIDNPPSATRPAPKLGSDDPQQIAVPLPSDVDPDCRIELKNRDGSIGLQIARCSSRSPVSRIASINKEIDKADELLFSPSQYVDRALFPGETTHERPTAPMPNRYEHVTLAVLLSAIVLKQRDWMRLLNEQLLPMWDHEHPVWVEWSKRPTAEPVWIVALRRTLPDGKGRVYWIPEIELRFQ